MKIILFYCIIVYNVIILVKKPSKIDREYNTRLLRYYMHTEIWYFYNKLYLVDSCIEHNNTILCIEFP